MCNNQIPVIALLFITSLLVVQGSASPPVSRKEPDQKKEKPPWNTIRAVGVSPDCKRVATVSDNDTVEIWDFYRTQKKNAYPEPLLTFPKLSPKYCNRVFYSIDGAKLYLCQIAKPIEVDPQGGKVLREFTDPSASGQIMDMKLAPDGKRIVTLHPSCIKIWDIAMGACVQTIGEVAVVSDQRFAQMVLSGDGKRLLTGSETGAVLEWGLEKGECLRKLRVTAKDTDVCGLAYGDEGNKVIVAHGGGGLRVWDLRDSTIERVLTKYQALPFGMSPNGKVVAAYYAARVHLWDWRSGRETAVLPDYEISAGSLTFTPDNRYLVVTGSRSSKAWAKRLPGNGVVEDRAILVWDLRTSQVAGLLAYPSPEQSR